MTDDRIAQIEHIIIALERNGPNWTNQMVFAHVGGSYSELSQYLKARRAGEVGPSTRRQAREPSTPSSVYADFVAERDTLATTLAELDASDVQNLEVLAQVRTRLVLVEERLPALQVEAESYERTQARQRLIVEQTPVWSQAAEEKTSAIAEMQRLVKELYEAVAAYNKAHGQQEWCARRICTRDFATDYGQQVARLAQVVGACFHPTEQQRAWGKSTLSTFDAIGRNPALPIYN